jgi:hypothetical protein
MFFECVAALLLLTSHLPRSKIDTEFVIPAEAGIQYFLDITLNLDSRLRGNDPVIYSLPLSLIADPTLNVE